MPDVGGLEKKNEKRLKEVQEKIEKETENDEKRKVRMLS